MGDNLPRPLQLGLRRIGRPRDAVGAPDWHIGAMPHLDMSRVMAARFGAALRSRVPPEPSFRREAAANVPGQITSSRNSRGPVSQGDRPRPELMAIHKLELDALAQTGEQRQPV